MNLWIDLVIVFSLVVLPAAFATPFLPIGFVPFGLNCAPASGGRVRPAGA
jgi:hypothetical protein